MGRGEWRNKGKVGKIEQISRRGDKERKEERPVSGDNERRGPERKRPASSLFHDFFFLKTPSE